ncbi:O-antigen ligase family protein [Bacillus cereus]|uniref:O-antigen ligase family protein n=1 Tax=Bacillus TaxID=1386 RepID=UPI0025709339|nr:O-antigen ligase family protein [Bacillus cereus]WJE20183.1 O-antigen ligase family protein [Bacillus cereus]HDR7631644.1 O-antigen ligase family protein [Bacillus mycoides]
MTYMYMILILPFVLIVAAYSMQLILKCLNKKPNKVVLAILWIIGVGPIIQEMKTDRIIENTHQVIVAPLSFLNGIEFNQIIFLVSLFINFVIFIFILKRGPNKSTISSEGKVILVSYIIYHIGILAACILGTKPYFSINIFMSLILLIGCILIIDYGAIKEIIKHIQYILLTYIYMSLLLGMLYPEWATTSYVNLLPIFNSRLSGVLAHANGLGPVAVLYIIFSRLVLSEKNTYRGMHLFAALIVLLWTESKTAIFILILVWVISLVNSFWESRGFRILFSCTLVISMISFYLFFIISQFNANGLFYKVVNEINKLLEEFSTLTGRFEIWNITIKTWLDNIMFGYGPEIWNLEFRTSYGKEYAGQAHNQFIQSLGETGLFGFICMTVFVGCLVYYGIKLSKETKSVSLMLVAFLLIRCITETPFRNYTIQVQMFSLICILIYLSYSRLNNSDRY